MTPAAGDAAAPLILLVDDYADNRAMYARYLVFEGFRVDEARDGQEALDKAGLTLPNLIVMDLSLPILDGWEATRRLKAQSRTRGIPVLALTGYVFGQREAIRAGCDAYMTKPCLPEDLAARIRLMLEAAPRKRPKGKGRRRGE